MSKPKIAGLYWTKEDIDSACQIYAIHIAVTNHLVCTIDTDVPSAETFANLFAAAPDLLEACEAALTELYDIIQSEFATTSNPHPADGDPHVLQLHAAIAKAKGEKS